MTDTDVLIEKAAKSLYEHPDVHLQLDMATATCIIWQLQLAMRHPDNTGQSRTLTENFVRDLIEHIDPSHGDVYRLLMMGFDPARDE